MYFKFFKLHSWDKRSADNRRRLIQRLLNRLRKRRAAALRFSPRKTYISSFFIRRNRV